jgi:hypothetical protein
VRAGAGAAARKGACSRGGGDDGDARCSAKHARDVGAARATPQRLSRDVGDAPARGRPLGPDAGDDAPARRLSLAFADARERPRGPSRIGPFACFDAPWLLSLGGNNRGICATAERSSS